MLAQITRFFAGRREKAEAIGAAIRRFESAPDRSAHRGISSVLHSDELGFVVRVCYGHTRPPGRAWFRVSRGAADVQELSFDEVRQYGEKPWR
jgi:hypothetical protein